MPSPAAKIAFGGLTARLEFHAVEANGRSYAEMVVTEDAEPKLELLLVDIERDVAFMPADRCIGCVRDRAWSYFRFRPSMAYFSPSASRVLNPAAFTLVCAFLIDRYAPLEGCSARALR